jgi:hypothetical protein
MAKPKSSNNSGIIKTSFGKRKKGNAKKSYNKHTPRPKEYVGQGR